MTATMRSLEEAAVRQAVEDRFQADSAKDVDAAFACYATDVVRYDLPPPLQFVGEQAHDRDGLQAWFDSWKGDLTFELRDWTYSVSDGEAFAYGLSRMQGVKKSGERADLWTRVTICLRKIDGSWKIVHEHVSVPFYMDGSFRAAVDLKP